MALSDLTDPRAVREAIEEFLQIGREEFLSKYGFGPARGYFVRVDDQLLDSKAVAGAAHGYQFPAQGPLKAEDFSGGESTVRRKLESLGFEVEVTQRRNPAWTREELILALDLYLHRWPGIEQDDPELQELSNLLNALPIHSDRPDTVRFRNPNGVHMKLANFVRFDPSREGSGLSRGNKLEEVVWNAYANDRARLREAVDAIKTHTHQSGEWQHPEEDENEVGVDEGKLLYRAHRQRERSSAVVKRKKAQALERDGKLICEVCGFDFQRQYPALEKPFIECHHIVPLAKLRPGQRTRLADLSLVCANCHRALHRMPDPSDLAGLRSDPELTPTEVWCPEDADPVRRGVWSSEKPTSQLCYAYALAERLSDALERWIEHEGEQVVYESLATSYYLIQADSGPRGWARTVMEYNYERGSLPDTETMVRVTLTPEQEEEFWNVDYGDIV